MEADMILKAKTMIMKIILIGIGKMKIMQLS